MDIETRELENRQVEIQVNVPDDLLERAMHGAARQLSKKTRIKGFRPGKAPYQVVLTHFGEEYVFEEALERLSQDVYRSALDESELEPYAPGSFNEIVSREPLVLRYTVPLAPEVELGDYNAIRLPYEPASIDEEDVTRSLDELLERRALIEPKEGAAEKNDLVIVDIKAELSEVEEDEEATLFDRKGMELIASDDTDWPMPGIADHLIGMKPGDEKNVAHTFNEEYPVESLRERSATFTIVCQDVKSRTLPEWDDELAQSMGDFNTVEDLQAKIRENLLIQAERSVDAEYSSRIVDQLVEEASISYPPVLLEDETNQLISEFEQQLSQQRLTLEDYIKIQQTTIEEIRTEFEPQARQRLDRGLALGKLVEVEELKVDEKDIDSRLDEMAQAWNEDADRVREALNSPASRRRLEVDLLTDKAIQFLMATAKGEDPRAVIEQPEEVEEPAAEREALAETAAEAEVAETEAAEAEKQEPAEDNEVAGDVEEPPAEE